MSYVGTVLPCSLSHVAVFVGACGVICWDCSTMQPVSCCCVCRSLWCHVGTVLPCSLSHVAVFVGACGVMLGLFYHAACLMLMCF